MTQKKFTFNLIENAKDSLEHAITHIQPLNNKSASNWKVIIVNLAHVVELILKEKLQTIHPAFIYKDIDNYPSSDFFSITTEHAIKRLKRIGNLDLEKKDILAIDTARKIRNQIEHFKFEFTEQEIKVISGEILDFIFRFSKNHLELDWEKELTPHKWSLIYTNTEFYKNKLSEVDKKIEFNKLEVLTCTLCNNKTFSLDGICLLCDYKEDVLHCLGCRKHPYLKSACHATFCENCLYELDSLLGL